MPIHARKTMYIGLKNSEQLRRRIQFVYIKKAYNNSFRAAFFFRPIPYQRSRRLVIIIKVMRDVDTIQWVNRCVRGTYKEQRGSGFYVFTIRCCESACSDDLSQIGVMHFSLVYYRFD